MALAVLVSSLTACSNVTRWNPEDYTVKSGDTLFSIAWRYELDTDELAAWNNIRTSAPIKPGQRLHTRKPAGFKASRFKASRPAARAQAIATVPLSWPQSNSITAQTSDQKWIKARKGDTLYALSRRYSVDVKRLAQLNQLSSPYVIQPGQTIFLKPLDSVAKSTAVKSTSAGKSQSSRQATLASTPVIRWPGKVRWQRPAKGKIVKKFNHQKNDAKGIDIAGKQGSAIVAAADGKVVYSGNGLISYGNLIIIKHNKTFLSAYAYNRKLLVKEGDRVKAGQQVAEMGNKEKSQPRLHFEIRKNGKPVNPLKYLPW